MIKVRRSLRKQNIKTKRWTRGGGEMDSPTPVYSSLHCGPLKTSSSMISSSWPVMKSNWLWLSSIINEPIGSLRLQAIWQMALSIYYCACHSGSFSKWFMLWKWVIKGFALQAFSRFWHSLRYFFFLGLRQKRNNQVILSESKYISIFIAGDPGSISGLGSSLGEEISYPLLS